MRPAGPDWQEYLRLDRASAVRHEYVLVSHREQLVEVFRREASGEWRRTEARAHSVARLESISCDLDVDRLYAAIDLHRGG